MFGFMNPRRRELSNFALSLLALVLLAGAAANVVSRWGPEQPHSQPLTGSEWRWAPAPDEDVGAVVAAEFGYEQGSFFDHMLTLHYRQSATSRTLDALVGVGGVEVANIQPGRYSIDIQFGHAFTRDEIVSSLRRAGLLAYPDGWSGTTIIGPLTVEGSTFVPADKSKTQ